MTQFKSLGDGFLIGPQPTAADLKQARQQGVKTVVDFRLPTETATSNEALVKGCGLAYANVPVDKAHPSAQLVDQLDAALQENEGPFLLHCASGARAALLLALSRARRNHWNAERTFEEARSIGFDLQTSPEYSSFVARQTSR
jgi:uncharacterized protein (TIGR01244 family)